MKRVLTGILGIAAFCCMIIGTAFLIAPQKTFAESSTISAELIDRYVREISAASSAEKAVLEADSADKLSSGRDTGNGATVGVVVDEAYGQVWTLSGTVAANTGFYATTPIDVTGYSKITFKVYNPTDTDIVLVLYTGSWGEGKVISTTANAWTDVEVDTAIYGGNFFFVINSADWIQGIWKITSFVGIGDPVEGLLFAPSNGSFEKSCSYGGSVAVATEKDSVYGDVFTIQVSQTGEQGLHLSRQIDTTGYESVIFSIYNPCAQERTLNIHGGWSAWGRVSQKLAAKQWTQVTVPASVFTEDKEGYIYPVLSGSDTASDIWKITGFVGINNAKIVEHFIDKLPEASEAAGENVVKYVLSYKSVISEIQSSFKALTEEEKAAISTAKQSKLTAVAEAFNDYGIVLEADSADKLSTGKNNIAGGSVMGVEENETYGNTWRLNMPATGIDFSITNTYHEQFEADIKNYSEVYFYIYNPTEATVILSWYYQGWGNGSENISIAPNAWNKVILDTSKLTSASFFVLNGNNGGEWLVSSFLGKIKEVSVTITDKSGETLAMGAGALSFDGTTLNGNGEIFVGFTYNGKLYKSVADAIGAASEETITIVAATWYVKTEKGASVRVTGTPGIRFDAYIDKDASGYGVILSAPELFGNNEFTIESLTANRINFKNAYSKAENFRVEEREGMNFCSIVLQNIKVENYKRYFAARAYVEAEYADGSTKIFYAEYSHNDNSRSVYDVAKAAYDNNGYATEEQKKVLEKFISTILVSATETSNLSSGRDTGNGATVGIAVDETYGAVWTLSGTVAANTDFHATAAIDVTGYGKITFKVYNPTSSDIVLVLYTGSWGEGKVISTTANEWTDVEVDTAIYGGNFFFVINSADWIQGTWKITSFEGIPETQNSQSKYNEFTKSALNGALSVDAKKKFELNAYDGPTSGIIHNNRADNNDVWVLYRNSATLSDLKKYKDAGFRYWSADNAWYGRSYLKQFAGMNYEHDAYWALDMAAEYYFVYGEECPVIITIDGLANSMKGTFAINNVVTDEANYKLFLEQAIRNLKSYIPSNGGKNFFAGLQLCDEPDINITDSYKRMYRFLSEDLGLSAGGYILNSALFGMAATSDYIGSSYESYLAAYGEAVSGNNLILYDNYPFKRKDNWIFGEKPVLVDSYFKNLQLFSVYAKANGLKAGTCIQSMKFNSDQKSYYSIESRSQISMQVYCALAFGYEYLNYFVYTEPYGLNDKEIYEDACVMWDTSNNTLVYKDLYTWVNGVNNEIKGFENVLLSFDYKGTQVVKSPAGTALDTSYGAVTASATYATLIGHFKQDDLNAYLVANAYDPENNSKDNTVTLTIGTDSAVVYIDGMPSVANTSGGKLTLSLPAGSGAFVIPVP